MIYENTNTKVPSCR